MKLDDPGMDTNLDTQITKAIAAHAKWKRRLRDAIETGTSDIDTSTAGRDNVCEFGKWLHGDVPASQKGSPHYTQHASSCTRSSTRRPPMSWCSRSGARRTRLSSC